MLKKVVTACSLAGMFLMASPAMATILDVTGDQFLFGTALDNGVTVTYNSSGGSPIVLDSNNPNFSISDGATNGGAQAYGEQSAQLSNGVFSSQSNNRIRAEHDWQPGEPPHLATSGTHSTLIFYEINLGSANTFFSIDYSFDINILGLGSTATWFGAVAVGDSSDDFKYLDESFQVVAETDFNDSFSGTISGFSDQDNITIFVDSQMSGGGGPFDIPYLVTGSHGFDVTLNTNPVTEVSAPNALFFILPSLLFACGLYRRSTR